MRKDRFLTEGNIGAVEDFHSTPATEVFDRHYFDRALGSQMQSANDARDANLLGRVLIQLQLHAS